MRTDLVELAVRAQYGPRCHKFDGCHVCKAWQQFDTLVAKAYYPKKVPKRRA